MNKLILDGVEYELSDELVEKLKGAVAEKAKAAPSYGPFDRESGGTYCHIEPNGYVCELVDDDIDYDERLFAVGNYCRDKEMMEQRALHETLNRLLWRYSVMHGGDAPWREDMRHFFVSAKHDSGVAVVVWAYEFKCEGVIYFRSEEAASSAIENIVKPFMAAHPEFVW